MTPVYGWIIRRASGSMTITHKSGKITEVVAVEPRFVEGCWRIIATQGNGTEYDLQPGAPN